MDYKRIWLKYHTKQQIDDSDNMLTINAIPTESDDSTAADREIKQLLNLGWTIESTCPIIGSTNILNSKGDDVYTTYTIGIEVFMVKK